MKKRHFIALGLFILATGLIVSCSKINMATELGQGLIPEVDNIHTFDTTLEVHAFNGIFTAQNDSFRSHYSNAQLLGTITNDPIFGKTDAKMYFQISPNSKTPFSNSPDKRMLDSVVLVLDHSFIYGDTLLPQTIQVSELAQSNDIKGDTSYFLTKVLSTAGVLGSKTFVPRTLRDSMQVIEHSAVNKFDTSNVISQLRIKLDNAFGQRLLAYDTTGANDAYSTDSIFRTKFKGFALESVGGGNGLMGFSLTNAQLRVYYRYENTTTAGDIDTATGVFYFTKASLLGNENGSANYISRDYSGTQVLAVSGDNVEDPILYLQNTPGTFATLKIPGLATFPKSVIHLAELQMESIYDQSDSLFSAPRNLFLDVYDSTDQKFKLVPYVFNASVVYGSPPTLTNFASFYSTTNANQTYYNKKDPSGNIVKQWRFNITGYLQNIGLQKVPAFDFRLYAPANEVLLLGDRGASTDVKFPIPQSQYNSIAGYGRARIGGGNHPTQKMKLRIVYSKP
ncbi:DUF4270 domain-containing protein [Niabella sp.]|uniref:DUF4270 domain-containing protein n=1 Tax=Niabella sp. TaxID=1962976 RepID=UPI00261A4893|nr:DUF4270 domain-containing protein [Niabella sp.]